MRLADFSASVLALTVAGAAACAQENAVARPSGCDLVAAEVVGPQGGELQVSKAGSPLDGLRVVLPPGALDRDARVLISHCLRQIEVAAGVASGVYLRLETDGPTAFEAPVLIVTRYRPPLGKSMPVPYRVEDDGSLAVAQIHHLDKADRILTIATFRAGLFTWIFA